MENGVARNIGFAEKLQAGKVRREVKSRQALLPRV